MNETVDERDIAEFTSSNATIAIAECIGGLGCTVHAGGEDLVWAGPLVESLVGVFKRDGAVITTETTVQYYVLR